jgi:membrane protease YdiL (CAAX protease family)
MELTIDRQKDQMNARDQYTAWQMLGIWLAGGAPMWILGWLVYPAVSKGLTVADAGLWRLRLMTIGLIWQFLLSMIILYREEGNIRWATIRRRFWLSHPSSSRTGQVDKRLWWWIIPLGVLYVAMDFVISTPLNRLWVNALPFLAEPEGYHASSLFAPELRAQWVGSWNLLALFLALAVFNTFLGEEFLFRGVLLPKMQGVFGEWDWVVNGIGFGLYHLHQPWVLPGSILVGLVLAFSGKLFRSNWFPIILHFGQSVYLAVLILGLVLGLA